MNNKKIAVTWASLVMLSSIIVIIVEIAPRVEAPTTWYVDDVAGSSGPDDPLENFTSIQDAINASNDGDTVYVYSGTYYENVVVNKTINLTGISRDNTTINGSGNGDVVYVNVNWVNITGFTVTGGGSNFGDAGIELNNVRNSIIINNNASNNVHGIYLNNSSNNILENNTVYFNTEGIYLESPNIDICLIADGDDGTSAHNHLISRGYSVTLHSQTETESLSSMYYSTFDLVIFRGNGLVHTPGNIIDANVPFITTSAHHADDLYLGTGETLHQSRSDFNVINNVHFITDPYPLGPLTFESNIWTDATDPTDYDSLVLVNSGNTNEAILIVNVTDKYAFFGWYRFAQMSPTGWNLFDRTVTWALEEKNTINTITNCIVSNNQYGIYLECSSGNSIIVNIVSKNNQGIYLESSSINRIYYNIIDNTIQAYDDRGDNYWDNDYPFGGNYWSDYVGVDNLKGPNQNIPGIDGIGDTDYSIDSDSIDHYPLMEPYTPLENYTILKQGWNLISIPLIQKEQNLTRVLGSIDSWYDAAQWYNPIDINDPWKHYKVGKAFGNDLSRINESMGFWIHITNPGDTIFIYNGTQLTVNQTIKLYPGWNLVGYPSLSNKNRTEALNNLTFGSDVDAIWTYNATTQTWKEITVSDNFEVGRGYWVHSKVTKTWIVPL